MLQNPSETHNKPPIPLLTPGRPPPVSFSPSMAAASQSDAPRREPGQRRSMCGVRTKPLRLCLCGRLRSPPVDTAVGVTVLQHAMEAHHPLNSTRVARLGLRNLAVVQPPGHRRQPAHFILTALEAGGATASGPGGGPVTARSGNLAFRRDGACGKSDGEVGASCDFEEPWLNPSGNFGFEKMKSDGQPADLERPSSATNQIGNSGVGSVNGETNRRSEVEKKLKLVLILGKIGPGKAWISALLHSRTRN
ncbi:hypothetical protein PVAP13_9NG231573 [Panicum virgatum]|uniref:Uncharacterized protein n=1 Tax=Panicum virgatum TaxID=38727 RepID=A0A8T0MKM0_PANVG|nr:hypothetical protein PVAP13_9NG231573 [Panicum virgatum]